MHIKTKISSHFDRKTQENKHTEFQEIARKCARISFDKFSKKMPRAEWNFRFSYLQDWSVPLPHRCRHCAACDRNSIREDIILLENYLKKANPPDFGFKD